MTTEHVPSNGIHRTPNGRAWAIVHFGEGDEQLVGFLEYSAQQQDVTVGAAMKGLAEAARIRQQEETSLDLLGYHEIPGSRPE